MGRIRIATSQPSPVTCGRVCARGGCRYVFMMIFSGLLVSINSWPDYTRWLGYVSFCKCAAAPPLPSITRTHASARARTHARTPPLPETPSAAAAWPIPAPAAAACPAPPPPRPPSLSPVRAGAARGARGCSEPRRACRCSRTLARRRTRAAGTVTKSDPQPGGGGRGGQRGEWGGGRGGEGESPCWCRAPSVAVTRIQPNEGRPSGWMGPRQPLAGAGAGLA
jgi:hypothetical protein